MKNNKHVTIFILLIAISVVLPINGNSQDIDYQLWMNYTLTIPVNNNLSYGGDLGLRGSFSNYDWTQILVRPRITYRFNSSVGVAGALAWFGTANRDNFNVNEFRIHQDLNLKWPDLGVVHFFYRIRIEERFFYYQDENIANSFTVRFRGLFGIETQDFTWFGSKTPIYFQAIIESFRTLDDESAFELFVNNRRLNFAYGHRISNGFRYELHYINQGSRLFSDDGLKTNQNIFRIRFYHRLHKE